MPWYPSAPAAMAAACLAAGCASPDATIRPADAGTLALAAEYEALPAAHRLRLAADSEPGTRLRVLGRLVRASGGGPLAGYPVEVYHADAGGRYGESVPGDESTARLRGTVRTDGDGRFLVSTIVPGDYGSTPDNRHIHLRVPGARPDAYDYYFLQHINRGLYAWARGSDQAVVLDLKQTAEGLVAVGELPVRGLEDGDRSRAGPSAACRAGPDAPRLDHVVLAVGDLDRSAAALAGLGFRLKPGRLHANHLRNRHVRFADGTALELMTVQGEPLDATARGYAALLARGEGGAFVALGAADLDAVARAAGEAGLITRPSRSGGWRFLDFPGSDAAAVFFGTGWTGAAEADTLVTHPNGADGLVEAWVEAGPGLVALLERLGAARCDTLPLPGGQAGERWALGQGYLTLVPPTATGAPRPLGAVLKQVPGTAWALDTALGQGFRLGVRPGAGRTAGPGTIRAPGP